MIFFLFFVIESAFKSTDIDYSLYTSKELSPDYSVFWRILKEQQEIEIVLKVNGTSWVGFGWRPRTLTAKCRNFPIIQEFGVPTPHGLLEPDEPSSEPEPEPKSEPEPEPKSEPEPEPKSVPEPEPKSEPEPEPKSEPEPEPKSDAPKSVISPKSKRVAGNEETTVKNEQLTVATSVSYQVSAKTGRKRRAVEGKLIV